MYVVLLQEADYENSELSILFASKSLREETTSHRHHALLQNCTHKSKAPASLRAAGGREVEESTQAKCLDCI